MKNDLIKKVIDYWATCSNNSSEINRYLIPGIDISNSLADIYKIDHKISDNIDYSASNLDTPIFLNEILNDDLLLDDHNFMSNIELNNSEYAQYFLPHSQFEELYIGIITPSGAINEFRQKSLIAVILSFILVLA